MERWGSPGVRAAVLSRLSDYLAIHRTLEIVLNLTSRFIKQFHMHYLICASQNLYRWDKYHHLSLWFKILPTSLRRKSESLPWLGRPYMIPSLATPPLSLLPCLFLSHWPLDLSLNTTRRFLPQGLCTYCFLCL